MKNLLKTFVYGATMAAGTMAGIGLFTTVTDPVQRKKIKNKIIKIKDTVLKK
jgi:hypothetical protein